MMMRSLRSWAVAMSFVLPAAVVGAEVARYDIDPEHTTIGFSAVHTIVGDEIMIKINAECSKAKSGSR